MKQIDVGSRDEVVKNALDAIKKWVPVFHGEMVVWIDRENFDELKRRKNRKPCDIFPKDVKSKCYKEDDEYKELDELVERHRKGKN